MTNPPAAERGLTRVHEEIRQSVPFRSPSQEALIGVARTASLLERVTARALAPEGLSTAQYNVLRILRGAGRTGLPTLEIRERLIDPCAAITRLVDKLEQSGLLSREREAEDRRQVTCRITPKGLEVLTRLEPAVDAIDDAFGRDLAEDELEVLSRALDRVRAGLRDTFGG